MSYDIYIGEAKPEYPSVDNGWRFDWVVERTSHPDAPSWDCKPDEFGAVDISGKTNGRHPGYSQMTGFCIEARLTNLFFEGDNALMGQHPGIVPLLPEHIEKITKARQDWEDNHPHAIPGWNEDEDPILARLIWYEWWMKWAVKNCDHPAVENL